MKLWVDDIRPAPEDWKWIKSSQEFSTYEILGHICEGNVKEISFDHDLGEDSSQNGYQLLNLLEEMIAFKLLPKENVPILTVHSMNPVGRQNMWRAIESIKKLVL